MKFGLAEIMLIVGIVFGILIAGRMNRSRRVNGSTGRMQSPKGRKGSQADELAKLAWLHENGKLTDKEYNRQKMKILRKPW